MNSTRQVCMHLIMKVNQSVLSCYFVFFCCNFFKNKAKNMKRTVSVLPANCFLFAV